MGQPKSDNNQGSLKNIAIIMDGNGRWAKSNKLQITQGHEKGVGVVKDIVEECVTQNIDTLTVYAFSSENWARPKKEINGIKTLIIKAISDQVPELIDQRVKLNFFGDLEDFGSKIIDKISKAQKDTFLTSPSLELNVALGYGGRSDIIQTSKILAKKVQDKEINIKDINEDIFSQLSLVPVDNIDLVIRTGTNESCEKISSLISFHNSH